ncbi:MAG: hypothetical protein ACK2T4_09450 [Candidatus Promineifilaceae bacterium]
MNPLAQLAEQIAAHYNLSELEALCFELDINFENLEGTTLNDKARGLVLYCQRRQLLAGLLASLDQQRPDVSWPSLAEIGDKPQPLSVKPVSTPVSRRWWLLIPLLVIGVILVWRLWPSSPPPETTPAAGSTTDISDAPTMPGAAVSAPSTMTSAPASQKSPSPTQIVENPPAVLNPSTFATETPFVTLLSEGILVSSPGKSRNPVLLSDPVGGLHLAWWDDTARQGEAGDIFYQYRSPDGQWGEIERLTDETLQYVSEFETALRLRQDGVVCIFIADAAAGLQQKCRENEAWTPFKVIHEGFITESDPQIDQRGQPFVVYRDLADEIWFEDTLLADGLTGGVKPKFVIDSTGTFHVVWFVFDDGPYRLLHRQSMDSGVTWSDVETITSGSPLPDFPFILLADPAGKVHLVWHGFDGGHFYQVWSADGGWSQEEALPGQAENNCTSIDLQIAPEGDLLFSWQGGNGVFVTIRPSEKDQLWVNPFKVSSRSCRGFGPALATLPEQRFFLTYSDSGDDQVDLYGAELVFANE